MSKGVKNVFKTLTSIALAMILCLNLALPALARDFASGGSDASEPVEAALTKIFWMPINTPIPAATFNFTFTKVGMDYPLDNSLDAINKMPALGSSNGTAGSISITYTGDAVAIPDNGTLIEDALEGDKYAVKQSANFLAGIPASAWGNGEGIYRYKVTEADSSSISFYNTGTEYEVYSTAEYDVEVWVEEDENEVLYPRYVLVKIVTGKEDEYYVINGEPANGKVDPTPDGEGIIPGSPTFGDDFSQVFFTNKYWKKDGDDTDPKKNALEIVKNTKGSGHDPNKYFPFKITVTQPNVIPTTGAYPPAQSYKAYVIDAAGTVVNAAANGATGPTDSLGRYFTFVSGVENTFEVNLKHGERLAFVDLHVGSAVAVKEPGDTNYKISYKRTFSSTPSNKEFIADEAGIEFGFPRTSGDPGPHFTLAGQNANIATFINTRKGASPMGIGVDDLPYIVLIGAALVSLAGFVVLVFRKKAKNNA